MLLLFLCLSSPPSCCYCPGVCLRLSQREQLIELLRGFTSSRCLEVQQRSAEFVALLESPEWAADAAALFERMPLQQQSEQKQQRPVGEVCFDLADLPSELAPLDAAGDSPGSADKPATNGTGGQCQTASLCLPQIHISPRLFFWYSGPCVHLSAPGRGGDVLIFCLFSSMVVTPLQLHSWSWTTFLASPTPQQVRTRPLPRLLLLFLLPLPLQAATAAASTAA